MHPGTDITVILGRLEVLEAKSRRDDERIAELETVNARQAERIAELERQLRAHSGNSSRPPSTDGPAAPRSPSRAKPSGRKRGGQPGHRGRTLQFDRRPDDHAEHRPSACAKCGEGLAGAAATEHAHHLVLDIPPVQPVLTRHAVLACTCRSCGHRTVAERPAGVPRRARTAYGPNLVAFCVYWSERQIVATERLVEGIRQYCGIELSGATIHNMRRRLADGAAETLEAIREHIASAPVVGGDETTIRLDDDDLDTGRSYVWGWQTERAALLRLGPSRRAEVLAREFPEGFPAGVYVTDRYAGQFAVTARARQLCCPHLIRTCIGNAEYAADGWWSLSLLEVLTEITRVGARGRVATEEQRAGICAQLDYLLMSDDGGRHGELSERERKLRASLSRVKEMLVVCLEEAAVPPDNNATERLLRPLKVKMKVAGALRSRAGAEVCLALRSIIETAIKQGVDIVRALTTPKILEAQLAIAE